MLDKLFQVSPAALEKEYEKWKGKLKGDSGKSSANIRNVARDMISGIEGISNGDNPYAKSYIKGIFPTKGDYTGRDKPIKEKVKYVYDLCKGYLKSQKGLEYTYIGFIVKIYDVLVSRKNIFVFGKGFELYLKDPRSAGSFFYPIYIALAYTLENLVYNSIFKFVSSI